MTWHGASFDLMHIKVHVVCEGSRMCFRVIREWIGIKYKNSIPFTSHFYMMCKLYGSHSF